MEALAFGKYQLIEQLAEGGMAVVWRARIVGPSGFQKEFCLKQIRRDMAERREFVELFVAEAKLTVSLTHANIVPVYELGMLDGTYFLALELIDGPPLTQLMKKGPLPAPLAAYIVEQVLRGLDYAHRRGIVHRDLSPANVLVSRDGEVKIVDFGIAHGMDGAGDGAGRVQGGSRGYMAPEQERHEQVDGRADLYAVGVLLHELLSGRRFDAERPPDGAPEMLGAVVTRATAPDREERYPDAAAMLAHVSRFLRDMSMGPTQPELSAFVRKRCPDVARRPPGDDPTRRSGPVTALADGTRRTGPSTVPVDPTRSTGKQVTFATRIEAAVDEPEPRPRRSRALLVAGGLAVALLSVGAVWLRGRAGASTSVAPTAPPPPAATAAPAPAPAPAPVAAPAPAASAQPPKHHPPPRARGQLTLNALPWAHVTIDGEPQPDTPIQHLSLTAGPHTVRLQCPPTGRELKFTVVIAADAELRKLADLRAEPHLVE